MGRILVIEDEEDQRDLLVAMLASLGHEAVAAENGEQGLAAAREQEVDLAVIDVMMPGMSGIDVLKELKSMASWLPVILLTGLDRSEVAIEAMSYGAYDYLTKPVSRGVLDKVVAGALKASLQMRVPVEFEDTEAPAPMGERIIGQSPRMWDLYKQIGRVATTDATVLITGDSGTGKELVARAVYHHSLRRDKVFLTVNCAALPDSLLESELFGHEKGAFTGAVSTHLGKFEQCDGGTLFLDEIGDMSLPTQAKILRALQQKTFQRVGGTETMACDVRLIAATNKDLMKEVEEGAFREDLYYRLNVVHLHMPALRERKEDIAELSGYLLKQIAGEVGRPPAVLSAEALKQLLDHHWPGNVRELRNVLARAVVTSPTSVLVPEHISFQSPDSPAAFPPTPGLCPFSIPELDAMDAEIYDRVIGEVERRLLSYILDRTRGNKLRSAKLLGISRHKLSDRMSQFGIGDASPDSGGGGE